MRGKERKGKERKEKERDKKGGCGGHEDGEVRSRRCRVGGERLWLRMKYLPRAPLAKPSLDATLAKPTTRDLPN